jgi:hypothetical protein
MMKAKLTLIALSALALLANGANAQRRTGVQTPPGSIYESYSLGHQSYPNPDRDYLGETRYPAPTR